jgi:hypothetical protein
MARDHCGLSIVFEIWHEMLIGTRRKAPHPGASASIFDGRAELFDRAARTSALS